MITEVRLCSWILLVCFLLNVVLGNINVSVENAEIYSSLSKDVNFTYVINNGSYGNPKSIEVDVRPTSNTNLIDILLSVDMTSNSTEVNIYTQKNSNILTYNGRIDVAVELATSKLLIIFKIKNISNSDYEKEYRCTAFYTEFQKPYAYIVLRKAVSPKIYETSFFTTTNYFPLLIGLNYEFICRADGKPMPSILWLLNEQINSTGSGSAILRINNVQKSINLEKYICRAINIDGMDEKEMTLFIAYISSDNLYQRQNLKVASVVNEVCNIDGNPYPFYKWLDPFGKVISTEKRLQFGNIEDFGNYTCIANNTAGEKVFFLEIIRKDQNTVTLSPITGVGVLNQSSKVLVCCIWLLCCFLSVR